MTTEIEKQFFEAFGIEPRLAIRQQDWEKYKDTHRAEELYKCYPQITDRILLELICIINRFDIYFDYYYQDEYQVLRETILEDSINLNCKLKQTDFSELKHQVQAIFKESR